MLLRRLPQLQERVWAACHHGGACSSNCLQFKRRIFENSAIIITQEPWENREEAIWTTLKKCNKDFLLHTQQSTAFFSRRFTVRHCRWWIWVQLKIETQQNKENYKTNNNNKQVDSILCSFLIQSNHNVFAALSTCNVPFAMLLWVAKGQGETNFKGSKRGEEGNERNGLASGLGKNAGKVRDSPEWNSRAILGCFWPGYSKLQIIFTIFKSSGPR